MSKPNKICFAWEFIGPHHRARVVACAGRNTAVAVRAFALADRSLTYGFYKHDDSVAAIIAYRSNVVEDLTFLQRLRAYARYIWLARDDVYFLCHYERFEVFLTALVLRLRGRRVFVMNDSKFDDYQRYLVRELGKSFLYFPYCGGLVSGNRSASYLRFLGLRGKIRTGYDTIDVQRAYRLALDPPHIKLPSKFFISVNRLVRRKNVDTTIRAFHAACRNLDEAVSLVIVGEGPEEASLRLLSQNLGIQDRVMFVGNVPNEKVASLIARSDALVLLSTSEQWGLVVNEAVACRVPVIVSNAAGACDLLVRTFVNGFVVESDNEAGLTRAMLAISRDRQQFCSSEVGVHAASVERFCESVWELMER